MTNLFKAMMTGAAVTVLMNQANATEEFLGLKTTEGRKMNLQLAKAPFNGETLEINSLDGKSLKEHTYDMFQQLRINEIIQRSAQQMKSIEAELQRLKDGKVRIEESLNGLQSGVGGIEQTSQKIRLYEDRQKVLNEGVSLLESRLREVDTNVNETEYNFSSIVKNVESIRKQIAVLSFNLQHGENRIDEVAAKVIAADFQCEKLKTTVRSTSDDIKMLETAVITRINATNTNLQQIEKRTCEVISRIETARQQLGAQANFIGDNLKQLDDKVCEKNARMLEDIDLCSNEITAMKNNIQILEEKLRKTQVEQMRQNLDKIAQRAQDLDQRLNASETHGKKVENLVKTMGEKADSTNAMP